MGTKDSLISIRVDSATKERLTDAAGKRGQSLTAFVLDAAENAAAKGAKKMPTAKNMRKEGPLPTWFRATCYTATQGGASGYAYAGDKLFCALASEVPWTLDLEEWFARLNTLSPLIENADDEAVLAWFDAELPRCMALIPAKRRAQFLKGIYDAFEREGGIEI